MYYFVERSIVVLKPREAFLEWVNSTFTEIPQKLTLESIRVDCNTYLIPEVDEVEDGIKYVDDLYEDLFIMEFASWTEDASTWPKNLTLKMFWEWFDVEVFPTIIDLVAENNGENIDDDEEEDDEKNYSEDGTLH